MGRIRSALRAYAMETDDPADVLARLDRKIQLFEPDAMATTTYAVIAPDHGTVAISQAGHPPAALISPDGTATLLTAPTDLPLGAYLDAPRQTTTFPLTAGSGLFLYTDGLVERRGRSITDGIDEMLRLLGRHSAEDHCANATRRLLEDQPTTDDVAILAIQRES
jgi:serine phosphatase RsbU (regulator of sigma subunit)